MRKKIYYTAYNSGDEVIAFGTAEECCKALGLTIGSFYSAVSRSKKGKNKKYTFPKDITDDEAEN